jgi:hypothetical protein
VEHHLHGSGLEHEPIPGERDPNNLTHREPGAIGGHFTGADTPAPDPHAWLDDVTAGEHEKEGGGAAADRPGHDEGR